MNDQLPTGVPKRRGYDLLIKSDRYRKMEDFSNEFLSLNQKFLNKYTKRWVKDPLHQWSRQWEYPYVFSRVENTLRNKEAAQVLDAGSGITFFPYYIKSLYSATDLYCIDNDPDLEAIYNRINTNVEVATRFSCSDLKKTTFVSDRFDVIYCISVLEHVEGYEDVIEEFHRVLRPGGHLVITFDVSLDGTRDISVEKGTQLLKSLAEKFERVDDLPLDLNSIISTPDLFTTETAKLINPDLLPWKLPQFIYRINSLLRGNGYNTWPPLLTVFCLDLKKRSG